MKDAANYVYHYCLISVLLVGIVGNLLVIISIARQKQLLKKNYYFLVLHLAICDLEASVFELFGLTIFRLDVASYRGLDIACLLYVLHVPFILSGVAMMLMISLLRYRATVNPLKPTISRAKLIKVCYVVYVVSSIIGLGLAVPQCYIKVKLNDPTYMRFLCGSDLFIAIAPVIFMIVCYCKIGLALVKQNKEIKRMGSVAVRNRHNRDRRIFLVCLCTVLCFAVGRPLLSVSLIWRIAGKNYLVMKHRWIGFTGYILAVAGTVSANPVIYGILDDRMFRFLKLCKKKRQTPEKLAMQQM